MAAAEVAVTSPLSARRVSPSLSMGSVVCGASLSCATPGNGGDSMFGAGGRGVILSASGSASTNPGGGGGGYGAGGSGASAANAAPSNSSGGQGSQGIVIFTEYYSGEAAASPGQAPRGDCYLAYSGAGGGNGIHTLSRFNGRHLFINGVNEVIPAAGITIDGTKLPPPTALAAARCYSSMPL